MRQIKVGLTMTVTLGRVFMAGTEPPAQHALCQMLSQKTLNLGQSILIDLESFKAYLKASILFKSSFPIDIQISFKIDSQ